jgi:hypothetical protein
LVKLREERRLARIQARQEQKARKEAAPVAIKTPQLEDELTQEKTSRRRAKSVPREGGRRKTEEEPVEEKKTQ